MSGATLRLVLLVSCAHALVHVFELSFPSVEQLIADQYHADQRLTGLLGNCWRLPFGLFAMLAGWLADRFGARSMLVLYLAGCAMSAALAWLAPGLAWLFAAMFLMGTFASIYHPAGLALISHATAPQHRPLALGYHGIFGSAGVAAAPFLAALVLSRGASWQQFYLVLGVAGLLLALLLYAAFRRQQRDGFAPDRSHEPETIAHWSRYSVLLIISVLFGFIYSAQMNFLPRYLGEAGLRFGNLPAESVRNYLAAAVLLVGVVGQYVSGRVAHPRRLERLLVLILLGNVPCLAWMSLATGGTRVAAAALFVLVHFMHQPVYNSLVAAYVPSARRSLAYGLSNTLGFGVGSLGASFAGYALARYGATANYGLLAGLAACSTLTGLLLWRMSHNDLQLASPSVKTT